MSYYSTLMEVREMKRKVVHHLGNLKILSIRYFQNYMVITHLEDEICPDEPLPMSSAFSYQGLYLGNSRSAFRYVSRWGITQFYTTSRRTDGRAPVANMGFSPLHGKWYGWSHRAIYGFKLGSTCKPGNCHYQPSNPDEFLDDLKRWYKEPMYKGLELTPVKGGVRVEYSIWRGGNPKDALSFDSVEKYPRKWGRGTWKAKTWDDARQMAEDFARSVS